MSDDAREEPFREQSQFLPEKSLANIASHSLSPYGIPHR